MPSSVHNVIVELLEAHPEALEYLLTLQGAPPSGRLFPATGTRTKTFTMERRVDRAFLVGSRKAPKSFLLAEVQLEIDRSKIFSWPLYVELSRSRHGCEGGLVVLTFSERVRRWIEEEIVPRSGAHGSWRQMVPVVIAVDAIAPALLLRPDMPYLVQLAVAGHAQGPDAPAVAEQAVDITMDRLPTHLAAEQLDAILGMVDAALREKLESRVMEHREYRSELFRGIFQQGAAEGRAEGRAEGEAKGKAEGKAEAILAILAARDITVTGAIRKKILGCRSVETLDLWLRRAMEASTADAVIRGTAARRAATKRPAAKRTAAKRPAAKRTATKRPAAKTATRTRKTVA